MEVPPMTRTEAIKEFFKKAVLPVAIAGLPILSYPILIEREKREQKKKRERHPRPKPKAALPLCYGKVFKTASLHPSNRKGTPTW